MKRSDVIAFLQTVPLFSDLPKRELKYLAEQMRLETFRAGADLVTQGEMGR